MLSNRLPSNKKKVAAALLLGLCILSALYSLGGGGGGDDAVDITTHDLDYFDENERDVHIATRRYLKLERDEQRANRIRKRNARRERSERSLRNMGFQPDSNEATESDAEGEVVGARRRREPRRGL